MLLYTVDGSLVNFFTYIHYHGISNAPRVIERFAGSAATRPVENDSSLTLPQIYANIIKEWEDNSEWLSSCRLKYKVVEDAFTTLKGNIDQLKKQQTSLKEGVESANKMITSSGPNTEAQSQIIGDISPQDKQQLNNINRENQAGHEKLKSEGAKLKESLFKATQDTIASHTKQMNDQINGLEERIIELRKIQINAVKLKTEADVLQKAKKTLEKQMLSMSKSLQLDHERKKISDKLELSAFLETQRSAFQEIIQLVDTAVSYYYAGTFALLKEYKYTIESTKVLLASLAR